jgi:hypothetical protein
VTPEQPLLDFEEERLRERLAGLQLPHQIAFVASCCERAAPICIEFAQRSYLSHEEKLIRDVTDLTWHGSLEPESRLSERSVANELWRFASMDTDWAQPLSTYVPDCAMVLYFAADFQLTESVKSASEAARWIYNALDSLVLNRSGMTAGSSEESHRLIADTTIQRELRKQDRDLAALENAKHIDESLVRRLREESTRLGRTMLDEFEAEAQTRLRRGPPPRIYPDS